MRPRDLSYKVVREMLQEVLPPDGVAVLLLKHPVGPVHFPLEIAIGTLARGYPRECLKRYFLYPMALPLHFSNEPIVLRDDSSIEELVLTGKLAVALFPGNRRAKRAHLRGMIGA